MIDRACISLGERCNLNCSYCHFSGRSSGYVQEFSNEELICIIENIKSYSELNGVTDFKIGIVGAGEPLLEYEKIKHLIEYVDHPKYKNLCFYTITNGIVINDEILKFFYSHRDIISLCYSLDGYEELHNYGREAFQQVYENIKKYQKKFGKKPSINCTVHKQTIAYAEKVRNYFSDEGFSDVTFSRLVDCADDSLNISKEDFDDFIDGCKDYSFSVRQLKKGNLNKYDCTMYGRLCGVGRTNLFFTKQGIYPCGRFYGNEDCNYGSFEMNLTELQKKISNMKELLPGECYFDKYEGVCE